MLIHSFIINYSSGLIDDLGLNLEKTNNAQNNYWKHQQEISSKLRSGSNAITSLRIYQASSSDPCSFIEKTIAVRDYGLVSEGKFRILSESSLFLDSNSLNLLGEIAKNTYSVLVSFFNATPYDQDRNNITEVLVAQLNENYNANEVFIAGYTNPGKDPNGLGLIYLDSRVFRLYSLVEFHTLFAHELFHLIQASVIDLNKHEIWVIEGTAVFASDLAVIGYSPLWRNIRLTYNNFNLSLRTPLECLSIEGYIANYLISAVFFEFLAERYGLSIIKDLLFELKHLPSIKAIEKVTRSDFSDIFSEFAIWNYLGLYKGTNYTFEGVKVYANAQTVLNDTYNSRISSLSTHFIKINSNFNPSRIYIDYNGDLNFVLIKIKGDRFSNYAYEVLKVKNENYIMFNNKDYDEIILAIVNAGSQNVNYSIKLLPSDITVFTVTHTETQVVLQRYLDPLLVVSTILLGIALLITLIILLFSRSRRQQSFL